MRLKGKSDSRTGVDLRWHTKEEYSKLNKDQRAELYQWQQTKSGKDAIAKSRKNANRKGTTKKQLQAHVQALERQLEDLKDSKSNNSGEMTDIPSIAEIQAVIAAANPLPPEPNATPIPKPSKRQDDKYQLAAAAVQQIMKRSRKE